MKITVTESQRGFLFQKGCFVKLLMPGEYILFGKKQIQIANLSDPLTKRFDKAALTAFMKDSSFVSQTIRQEVKDGQIAVHYADGNYVGALPAGAYLYWNVTEKHSFTLYNITAKDVPEDIPLLLCEKLTRAGFMTSVTVQDSHKGMLFFNEKFQRVLEAGTYYFWNDGAVKYSVKLIETRKRLLNLPGQEILTKDKVGVRLNFVCSYQVTDCEKACLEIEDYEEQFRIAAQLVIREYVTSCTLDELLSQRDTIAGQLLESLRPKAEALYIAVSDAGIRDVILPGDIRDIMNTVLIAEKKAQANVITRREEVASTRSLLNTAKLMDENKTLYKLKELEYLEKICENVGNISVSGGDLLEQLRAILGSHN